MRKVYPGGVRALKGTVTMSFEIELDIEYVFNPEERMTRDYPGCPADVEVLDMALSMPAKDCQGRKVKEGQELKIPDVLYDSILFDHYDEIKELCMEDYKEKSAEVEIAGKLFRANEP